jgi:predicted ABC-type ATPase
MGDENPKIVIIAGPNGAGKSTLAPHLLRDTYGLLEYLNADVIALGLSAFQSEKVAFEAGRIMLKRLNLLAQQKESFAFESTLATRSYAHWIRTLIEQGYAFHLLYLWLQSPKLAIQRVEERVRLGGHDVPVDVIKRRYTVGVKNFLNLYQQLAESWCIYDNSIVGTPKLMARGIKTDQIDIADQNLWQEFNEVIK